MTSDRIRVSAASIDDLLSRQGKWFAASREAQDKGLLELRTALFSQQEEFTRWLWLIREDGDCRTLSVIVGSAQSIDVLRVGRRDAHGLADAAVPAPYSDYSPLNLGAAQVGARHFESELRRIAAQPMEDAAGTVDALNAYAEFLDASLTGGRLYKFDPRDGAVMAWLMQRGYEATEFALFGPGIEGPW